MLYLGSLLVFLYITEVVSDGISISNALAFSFNSSSHHYRRLASDIAGSLYGIVPPKFDQILGNHTNYLKRSPFPHMVYDGLFPLEVLRMVAEEIPDNPEKAKN